MKNVYVVLYNNFTALDVFGPVEVLSSIEEYRLHYVSLEGGIIENRQSVRIETEPLSTIENSEILVIPGGYGSRAEINNKQFLSILANAIKSSKYVLCVCTGSALVASTGILDNKQATSNKKAFEWVIGCRPNVHWIREARWVVAGKFYTSAGVSAGIDMTLGFISDIWGKDKALEICNRMEYHWNTKADFDLF